MFGNLCLMWGEKVCIIYIRFICVIFLFGFVIGEIYIYFVV